MYSYSDRLRAVELYIRLGKRLNPTIRHALIPKNWTVHNWSFPR